ncbi:porimin-like [Pieris napi]|uniref:porimin-like n=1 Tax=Pieris napi TaxID=78633 RepID=UPI001FB98457|nr:porimin-like [Pieris napi]
MKKVIFLCLLSVSLCVSKPANEGAAQASPQTLNSTVPSKGAESSTVPIPIPIPNLGINGTVATQAAPNQTKEVTEAATPVTEKSSQPIDNKTSEKKEEIKENSANPTKATPQEKPQEKSSTSKTEEAVTPPVIPSKEVPTKATSTVAPYDNATARPKEGHPGFDGASFVGGIILTMGLLAIGFMGFKYYKNHTERNYHTL